MAGPPPRRDDQTDILHTRPTRPSFRAIVRHHFIDPEEADDDGEGERLLKRTRNTDDGADAADDAAVAVGRIKL